MNEIMDKLPQVIKKLYRTIIKNDGQLWIYGETLCEICFTETSPIHFQLATNLTKEKCLEALDIPVSEVKLKDNELVLFCHKGKLLLLNQDFLPENNHERYYIDILCSANDFITTLKSFPFSIDRFAFDFQNLYHEDLVRADFQDKSLTIFKSEKKYLSTNILQLFKMVRFIVKFSLWKTDPIFPSIEVQNYDKGKMPDQSGWKREFSKLLELPKPSVGFEYLREWNILPHVFRELLEGYGLLQNDFHEYDVYYHSLTACDAAKAEEPFIRLGALFHDVGKPRTRRVVLNETTQRSQNVFYDHENIGSRMAYKILKKLGFSHQTVTKVSKLVRLHMFHYTNDWTNSAVRRFMKKANSDLNNLYKLRKADRVGSGKKSGESRALQNLDRRIKKIHEEENRLTVKDLAINGRDIMTHFHIPPGPEVGKILNYLLKVILDDPTQNNRESLIALADQFWKSMNHISHSAHA